MSNAASRRDLIVLVPDADMEFAIRSVLRRADALKTRPIKFDVHRHLQRDAGCRSDCHNYLRLYLDDYQHAVVLFDHEGSGEETLARGRLERKVEDILGRNGWNDRAAVVVIDPELEAWVWSDSPVVDEVLGWRGRTPPLRKWIRSQAEFSWSKTAGKPGRPKEALDAALRLAGKQHSPSVFEDLGARVSVDRCVDRAFGKPKKVLTRWFGR